MGHPIHTAIQTPGLPFETTYEKYLPEERVGDPHGYDTYQIDHDDYYDYQLSSDEPYASEDYQSDSFAPPPADDGMEEALRKIMNDLATTTTTSTTTTTQDQVVESQFELFPALAKQQLSGRASSLVGEQVSNASQSLLSQVDPSLSRVSNWSPHVWPSDHSPSLSQSDQLSNVPVIHEPQGRYQIGLGTRQAPGVLTKPLFRSSPGRVTGPLSQDSLHDFASDQFGSDRSEGKPLSQDHSSVASQPLHEQTLPVPNFVGQGAHDDVTSISKPDDAVEDLYTCLLCYEKFEVAEELAEHCQDGGHVSAVLKDCCQATVWKYVPPPFDKTPSQFSLCPR